MVQTAQLCAVLDKVVDMPVVVQRQAPDRGIVPQIVEENMRFPGRSSSWTRLLYNDRCWEWSMDVLAQSL